MFEKVILAVDGSRESLKAADLVEALADRFKGEILVMHVREISYSGAASWAPDWTPKLEDGIAELVNRLGSRGAKARSEIRACVVRRGRRSQSSPPRSAQTSSSWEARDDRG